ncbi:MAG: tRNA lysidine(34) synthetase TilS [Kutzneria sp.]|nr:tRNA lysidine(34) synthetase TilS [Kutzneria sp.]
MVTQPDQAVSAVRSAVKRLLSAARDAGQLTSGVIGVGVSGGADSLALAAGARHVTRRLGLRVRGLVVDHGLQSGSAEVAARAAAQLDGIGFDEVRVLPVRVDGPGGPEAAARRARYTALSRSMPTQGALVLLGHTLDDQAETVLLGLGRGSGPRSIAGMRPLNPPWGRPLLGLTRVTTEQACAALGLDTWRDPHNIDPAFTRVRLRHEVLPLLEDVLQGGVAAALARTAAQLREDCEALDEFAKHLLDRAREDQGPPWREGSVDACALAGVAAAVRRRAVRQWLLESGVANVTDAQLRRIDDLVGDWRGQGGVLLRGGLVARREHGRLLLDQAEPGRPTYQEDWR